MSIDARTRVILAISGSLRAASSNTKLLHAAARMAPDGVRVQLYDGLGELPHFNPDVEETACPEIVTELRELLRASDALLICTPEYAHGIPGVLKNALDWLVGSDAPNGKPAGVINASARSHHADESLKEVLRTMGFRLVDGASVVISLDGRKLSAEEMVQDAEIARALRAALAALA
jgi:NAD(P)H-dependent FMN reductase